MQVRQFKVTLQAEVVVSERAATEGGHGSLDYLPGAAFLGAVAARLYNTLSAQDAYDVFHSGKVRFGNALPLSEDKQLSYPMPLCWYTDKRNDTRILNYQHDEYTTETPKQMRGGYVSLGAFEDKNRFTHITPRFRMKTAINPEAGTAQYNQLFGYSSLPMGQTFVFKLEADEAIKQELIEQIEECFFQQNFKLGRSRSAEYGAVSIESFNKADELPPLDAAASEVTLWLLADAALQDQWGQPLLQPTADSVGLPTHFELNREKTFIRSRRYAPFNATRRRRDLERVVLGAGSVLHFSSQKKAGADELQRIQQQGIGLYRQTGLGRVWVNPKLLSIKDPPFDELDENSEGDGASLCENENSPTAPDHLVLRYLQKRKVHASDTNIIEKTAKEWKKELEPLYNSASSLSYTPVGTCPGPTPTQWGQVMEAAKNATSVKMLIDNLFNDEHAVCKEHDLQWYKRVVTAQNNIDNFSKWLRDKIDQWLRKKINAEKQELLPQIVARLARLAMDVAREKTLGK
jgi:hypothetical protein